MRRAPEELTADIASWVPAIELLAFRLASEVLDLTTRHLAHEAIVDHFDPSDGRHVPSVSHAILATLARQRRLEPPWSNRRWRDF